MHLRGIGFVVAAGLVAVFFATSTASAQTDAGGLLAPWPTGLSIESNSNAVIENEAHAKENGLGVRLDEYESQGRWKLLDQYKINPTVGYDAYYLDINSADPRLPKHLVDASVGFASPLAKVGDWFFAASGAVGYAGNDPMTQGNAYYGKFTALVGKELGPESNIIFGLDYDGNRVIFPDLPIPGFAYTLRINPTILAAVGFPYNTITWKPTDAFTLNVKYTFPSIFEAQATYELTHHIGVFANFTDTERAFHVEDLPHNRRLIFEQQRAEAGIRWDPIRNLSLLIGAGYAFDTKFDVAFDSRDAPNLLHVSDAAYVRIGLELRR